MTRRDTKKTERDTAGNGLLNVQDSMLGASSLESSVGAVMLALAHVDLVGRTGRLFAEDIADAAINSIRSRVTHVGLLYEPAESEYQFST
jgi:hypothetical protein